MSDTRRALGLRFEDDYQQPGSPRPSQRWSMVAVRVTTILGALLVGFLLTTGLTAGRHAALEQGARKAQLIQLVTVRQARTAALAERLEELRRRVAEAEQSVQMAGAPSLNAKLARVEAMTGLTAVRGPGVRVTFADAEGPCATGRLEDCRIQDVDLQLAANTLWGGGAEAVSINGERIIATSAIRSAGSSVLLNYRVLTSPYVIEAIGDAQALQEHFVNSELAEDFEVWRDVFGLGFDASAVDDLTVPAYTGAVRLRSAVNPESAVDG